MAKRALFVDGRKVFRDGRVVTVTVGDEGDCDCCGSDVFDCGGCGGAGSAPATLTMTMSGITDDTYTNCNEVLNATFVLDFLEEDGFGRCVYLYDDPTLDFRWRIHLSGMSGANPTIRVILSDQSNGFFGEFDCLAQGWLRTFTGLGPFDCLTFSGKAVTHPGTNTCTSCNFELGTAVVGA